MASSANAEIWTRQPAANQYAPATPYENVTSDEESSAVDHAHEENTAVAVRPVPMWRPAVEYVSKCDAFSPLKRKRRRVMYSMIKAKANPKPSTTPYPTPCESGGGIESAAILATTTTTRGEREVRGEMPKSGVVEKDWLIRKRGEVDKEGERSR